MLMFCGTAEAQEEWDNLPEEVRANGMSGVAQWFGQHADVYVNGEQLESPKTAKTVRINGGSATVTDGPFIEAKEVIGGYAVIDVVDEAAAIELAKTWPGGGIVEVRPVVPR